MELAKSGTFIMVKLTLVLIILIFSLTTFAIEVKSEQTPTATVKQRRTQVRHFSRFGISALIATWQETSAVEVDDKIQLTKAIIFGRGLSLDYDYKMGRWGVGLYAQLLNGQTDLVPIGGVNFPRRFWYGVNTGPRLLYRFTKDLELAHSLAISLKKIDKIGTSYSMGYTADLRMFLRPNFVLVQSLGTFGVKNSVAMATALRYDF